MCILLASTQFTFATGSLLAGLTKYKLYFLYFSFYSLTHSSPLLSPFMSLLAIWASSSRHSFLTSLRPYQRPSFRTVHSFYLIPILLTTFHRQIDYLVL
jgi:hypothetical protein